MSHRDIWIISLFLTKTRVNINKSVAVALMLFNLPKQDASLLVYYNISASPKSMALWQLNENHPKFPLLPVNHSQSRFSLTKKNCQNVKKKQFPLLHCVFYTHKVFLKTTSSFSQKYLNHPCFMADAVTNVLFNKLRPYLCLEFKFHIISVILLMNLVIFQNWSVDSW